MPIDQLEGGLSREIEAIRQPLLYAAAQFAAAVDYPDEDIAICRRRACAATLTQAKNACQALLDGAGSGRIAKEGLRCTLAGRPTSGSRRCSTRSPAPSAPS